MTECRSKQAAAEGQTRVDAGAGGVDRVDRVVTRALVTLLLKGEKRERVGPGDRPAECGSYRGRPSQTPL